MLARVDRRAVVPDAVRVVDGRRIGRVGAGEHPARSRS